MSTRATVLLIVTALCWGASFALIKLSMAELEPGVVMAARCAISMVVLWPFVWIMRRRSSDVEVARPNDRWSLFANGLMTAVPFLLVAWGMQSVDSSIAGIINASVPVWAALLAIRWDPAAPVGRTTIGGIVVGFSGIVLLFATRGAFTQRATALGLVACAVAAFIYASSGIYVRRKLAHRPSSVVATWSVMWGAILLTGASWKAIPSDVPSGTTLLALGVLGIVGTGVGMLTFYELLSVAGAARASLVTYLLPPLAIIWGAVLLSEQVHPDEIIAMLVILSGVWLASRPSRPREHTVSGGTHQ